MRTYTDEAFAAAYFTRTSTPQPLPVRSHVQFIQNKQQVLHGTIS